MQSEAEVLPSLFSLAELPGPRCSVQGTQGEATILPASWRPVRVPSVGYTQPVGRVGQCIVDMLSVRVWRAGEIPSRHW
jgi:hypothetical protein